MCILTIIYLNFLVGICGNIAGAIISVFFKAKTKNVSFALEFSAGIMVSVVFCDVIPIAFDENKFLPVFLGLVMGAFFIMLMQERIKYKEKVKSTTATGLMMLAPSVFRNMTDGIAIGTGFHLSASLGLSLAVALLVRNIPETIALSLSLKKEGVNEWKIIFLAAISGLPLGVGTCFGAVFGKINPEIISIILAFTAGVMIYSAIGDLIPTSKRLYVGRRSGVWNLLGILLGIFLVMGL